MAPLRRVCQSVEEAEAFDAALSPTEDPEEDADVEDDESDDEESEPLEVDSAEDPFAESADDEVDDGFFSPVERASLR